jgi:CRISPR/Cas system CSM-associated protein Csm3 (group 7 of RAMP superfamily)
MAGTQKQSPPEQDKRTRHRYITGRVIITGKLELTRPAHFGNGDVDELTDMPLIVDEVDGTPFVSGASLAGALRNYLREREWGYDMPMPPRNPQAPHYFEWSGTENDLMAAHLFGGYRGVPDGDQSPLIVDDALSDKKGLPEIELRDGVKLDAKTGTAEERKKYDYHLLPAGTQFDLRFELLLDDDKKKNEQRLKALAIALRGLTGRKQQDDEFEEGEIRLGARKRRGFGCCRVTNWKVTSYDFSNRKDLFAWLAADYQNKEKWKHQPKINQGSDIAELLGVKLSGDEIDRRDTFEIKADFEIDGSVMIRSGFSNQDTDPDTVHLRTKSRKGGKLEPILSGTSMAGAIRNRALRIANTLAAGCSAGAQKLIDSMFGPLRIGSGDEPYASRVLVNEEFVSGGRHDLVQTRIKIDRFTGGTIESALLEEAPHFGGAVKLRISLRNPEDDEIGLLLLVLKDLWLRDLPLGGESSVGRGRLRGIKATIRRKGQDEIVMTEDVGNGRINLSGGNSIAMLEACVGALNQRNWAEAK